MQNWSFVRDGRGMLYVGNNDGVLEYDGREWRLIRTANRSVVRGLAVDERGTVYVGGVGEFGYLKPGATGTLEYASLIDRLPPENRRFNEIWETWATAAGVVFRSLHAVYIVRDGRVAMVHHERPLQRSFLINGDIYIKEAGGGILRLRRDRLELIPGTEVLANEPVFVMLPRSRTDVLIAGRASGLMSMRIRADGAAAHIEKIKGCAEADQFIQKNNPYCGVRVDAQTFLIGSLQNGFVVIDADGRVLRQFNRQAGLPDDTIYNFLVDEQKNVWVATGNGLVYLESSSTFSRIDARMGVTGNGYTAFICPPDPETGERYLYLGTSKAILSRKLDDWGTPFRQLEEGNGQVWTLAAHRGRFLGGYIYGVLDIDPRTGAATDVLRSSDNIHIFQLLPLRQHPDILLACSLRGLYSLKFENGKWRSLGQVAGFQIQCRYCAEDREGNIWVGHEYLGVYRLKLSATMDRVEESKFYGTEAGLPAAFANRAYRLGDQVIFATTRGFYSFDERSERFTPMAELNRFLSCTGPLFPIEVDEWRNIWFQEETAAGFNRGVLRRQKDGSYRPELTPCKLLDPAERSIGINRLDRNLVVFCQSEGFVTFNPAAGESDTGALPVHIRRVSGGKTVQPLFSGTYADENGRVSSRQPETDRIAIPFAGNSLQIAFSFPYFRRANANRYATLLSGFESEWTPWSVNSYRDFTNLPPGKYRFLVKARNVFDRESDATDFRFRILTPWYRTVPALTGYILLGILGLLGIMHWRTRNLAEEKRKLEAMVAQRTSELAQKSEELKEMSLSDPLTQLRNRRYLAEVLSEEIGDFIRQKKYLISQPHRRRSIENNAVMGILLCDIDHFKQINDQYGHRAGDLFLSELSALMRSLIRQEDTVIRWGGEEFLIILKKTDPENLFHLAEKIRRTIYATHFPIEIDGIDLYGRSCSIGLIRYPFIEDEPEWISFDQVIVLADRAMYYGKESGRNRTVLLEHAGYVPRADEIAELIQSLAVAESRGFLRIRMQGEKPEGPNSLS